MYRVEEGEENPAMSTGAICDRITGPATLKRLAVYLLSRHGALQRLPAGYVLSEQGRRRAAHVIRTHRLWESFLHQNLPLPPDHLHATAERLEHVTDPALQQRLAAATKQPDLDPHGRQVPHPEK
jgi:Mn-dependent DtxR family transcriptional regulator